MKVLIYADEGVSSFSLQETLKTFRMRYANVETIDHKILCNSDWEKETSLLIIPGGRDIPYDRKLKGKGTAKIRKFVEEGGSFLGICAGAYFASAEVIFEKGTPIEVHEKRELSFFPGAAVGALYPHSPFVYESEKGSHASSVTFKEDELSLYYNGGCTFKDAEKYPGITILARFHDAGDQPAIIHCKVGKGSTILSGVHFEVSPKNLKKEGCEQQMIDQLKISDQKRDRLIAFLMSLLNL
ncbi:BPL-N domain-containing protein [Candidatus Neptunichlamydia sp. REUL1]|uniref:BPL-N domain-containing protein n=1 Tax=Candidatus Neptunichlamydia sp. REUL1 TaxID=3064277 RepID=UPI00292FED00|nr:BPL-N domain-containing protein [Candidatus Neptunochlamydia sp. REUL1]